MERVGDGRHEPAGAERRPKERNPTQRDNSKWTPSAAKMRNLSHKEGWLRSNPWRFLSGRRIPPSTMPAGSYASVTLPRGLGATARQP